MFKRMVAGVVMGMALGAGNASAEATRSVPLAWEDLPPQAAECVSARRAHVEGASVTHSRWKDGKRIFSIEFATGAECVVLAQKSAAVNMTCGSRVGYYHLVQLAGAAATLEWVEK